MMLGPPPVVEGVEVAPPPLLSAPPSVIEPAPAAPMTDPAPIELDPVVPETGANPTSKSGVGQTSHQALRPRGNLSTARRDTSVAPSADPLAGFTPRLEAPSVDTDAASVGVPPPADQVTLPGPEPGSTGSPPSPPQESTAQPATEPSTTNPNPTDAAGSQVSLAPGFRSFVDVAPRLAGGSLPTTSGWEWLAQQGFRTVLDLRPSADVRREDLAAINASGLRYVALPIENQSIDDPKTLARFASEINQEPAQPLYFFDTDGARASVMWYLHDVINRNTAMDSAAQKADEFGPRDPTLWSKARAYLDRLNPPAASPGTSQTIDLPDGPVPDIESSVPDRLKATARDLAEAAARLVAQTAEPQPSPPAPRDPTGWRPYAALMGAGLMVPLAFLGRSFAGHVGNRVLASLPAPRRSPKSLPDASDG